MKKLIIALSVFLSFSQAFAAEFNKGEDFYSKCSASENNSNIPACLAYLEGFAAGEYLGVMQATAKQNPEALKKGGMQYLESNFNYCTPPQLTTQETLTLVINWLSENPKDKDIALNIAINKALKAKYPCNK